MSRVRNKSKAAGMRRRKNIPDGSKKSMVAPFVATSAALYRPLGQIMPDRIRVQLVYSDPNQQRASVANNYSAWVFRVNSAYDPDPLIASGGISGFNELANFYYFYRVDAVSVDIEAGNEDDFCYTLGMCPTGTVNPGPLLSSRGACVDLLENPRSVQVLMPSSGGPVARMKAHYDLASIFGDRNQYLSDHDFTSAVGASPIFQLWLGLVLYTNGVVGVNGVTISTRLLFNIEFYNRVTLFG